MSDDDPTEDPTIELSDDRGPSSRRIGSYTIRRRIASGGMGTVYEAQQEEPRRSVAIKVMRAGRYTETGLRRFRYEAQLLARLRHPGVAQIYEAGSYEENGQQIPFFAMEYIPNAKPITEYVEERGLGTREILELFVQVCDAVHHGHQRGIVHRDLKPGNILVDSSGRPKIIDFGVARAADSDMAASTEQTRSGQIVGSLQYMSPEQFESDSADIDIRSDIYALGVVLYELLGKKLPYDVRGSAIHEVPTIVRETEPPPLGHVRSSLGGDLERIVGCALEKDRERRYQSAYGLRSDIQRCLSGEAITAHPPTLGYQLRVLVRRNKIWISAAAVALLAVIAGGVFSTSMYFRASTEKAKAELHAARSEKAIEFVGEMMHQTKPQGWGHQPTVADLIQNIRDRVDVVFADQPLVAAEIHSTIAWASLPQEDFESFEAHRRAAVDLQRANLAVGDPLTLDALRDLARAQAIRGSHEDLVETREELVELASITLAEGSRELLDERDSLVTAYELVHRYSDATAHAAYLRMKQQDVEAGCEMSRLAYETLGTRAAEDEWLANYVHGALAACRIMQGEIDGAASLYDQTYPRDPGIVHTFQGSPDFGREGAELLVMWETWCPFSQRAIPVVEDLYRRYEEDGLGVAGFTRVNRGSSEERVELFIRDRNITFPILKDGGKSWSYFGSPGTPFVILLSDGRVVWKSYVASSADLFGELVAALLDAHPSL